jgi:hypothetical protein
VDHHRALALCLRMIFSENRCALFRIMLLVHPSSLRYSIR